MSIFSRFLPLGWCLITLVTCFPMLAEDTVVSSLPPVSPAAAADSPASAHRLRSDFLKIDPVENVNWGPVEIHGAASQGFIFTGNQNYPTYQAGSGDFRMTDLLLNGNYNPLPNLRLGAQVYAGQLGHYGDMVPEIDWAGVDYQPSSYYGLRAGIFKLPIGLYRESLDVDSARTFVFLPLEFYEARNRTLTNSLEGGALYGNIPLGASSELGSLDYELFMGYKEIDDRSYFADSLTSGTPMTGEHFDMNYGTGFALTYNTPVRGLKLRSTYLYIDDLDLAGSAKTFAQVQATGTPALINRANGIGQTAWDRAIAHTPASLNTSAYNSFCFGAEYTIDKWTLAAEFRRTEAVPKFTLQGTVTQTDFRSQGWYLSASYQVNHWLTLGSYFSQYTSDYQDTDGTQQSLATGLPRSAYFQNDLALCTRFDISRNWLFKIEGHFIDGTALLYNEDGSNPPNSATRNPDWFLLAAKTTFNF